MKKDLEDAVCTQCDWTGDATGLTDCPICGEPLSRLDDLNGDVISEDNERYPRDLIRDDRPEKLIE